MTKTDELLREFADRWGHLEYAPDADMYEELCALIKQVEEERMPSEEEINNEANNYGELAKDNTPDYGVEENASLDFLRGASWLRSRLTQKTEGGGE